MDYNIAATLADIGLDHRNIIAGFCGGFVNMAYFRRSKPRNVMGLILAGGLMGNYFHPLIEHLLSTTAITASFITGMVGNALCHGAVEASKSWIKGLNK